MNQSFNQKGVRPLWLVDCFQRRDSCWVLIVPKPGLIDLLFNFP
jgi:hypothetical protein